MFRMRKSAISPELAANDHLRGSGEASHYRGPSASPAVRSAGVSYVIAQYYSAVEREPVFGRYF